MTNLPEEIRLQRKARVLKLRYADGSEHELPFEYLRVYSPSAEVKGHGPGQEVLVGGKARVEITEVVPTGNYAVKLVFDDGHDSGLYTWEYLRELGENRERYWQNYLEALEKAGMGREP
ncbi:MAG: DUF971 domain-containing protein [Gammaproteobacteria bacterium]|nr:MAG: DUF971 domain-containing protein [Gammaproteobacteria bacterium]